MSKKHIFFLFRNKKSLHGYREIDENACRGFWYFVSLPLNKQNNNFMRDPWTFQIWTFINVQKWILQDYLFSCD